MTLDKNKIKNDLKKNVAQAKGNQNVFINEEFLKYKSLAKIDKLDKFLRKNRLYVFLLRVIYIINARPFESIHGAILKYFVEFQLIKFILTTPKFLKKLPKIWLNNWKASIAYYLNSFYEKIIKQHINDDFRYAVRHQEYPRAILPKIGDVVAGITFTEAHVVLYQYYLNLVDSVLQHNEESMFEDEDDTDGEDQGEGDTPWSSWSIKDPREEMPYEVVILKGLGKYYRPSEILDLRRITQLNIVPAGEETGYEFPQSYIAYQEFIDTNLNWLPSMEAMDFHMDVFMGDDIDPYDIDDAANGHDLGFSGSLGHVEFPAKSPITQEKIINEEETDGEFYTGFGKDESFVDVVKELIVYIYIVDVNMPHQLKPDLVKRIEQNRNAHLKYMLAYDIDILNTVGGMPKHISPEDCMRFSQKHKTIWSMLFSYSVLIYYIWIFSTQGEDYIFNRIMYFKGIADRILELNVAQLKEYGWDMEDDALMDYELLDFLDDDLTLTWCWLQDFTWQIIIDPWGPDQKIMQEIINEYSDTSMDSEFWIKYFDDFGIEAIITDHWILDGELPSFVVESPPNTLDDVDIHPSAPLVIWMCSMNIFFIIILISVSVRKMFLMYWKETIGFSLFMLNEMYKDYFEEDVIVWIIIDNTYLFILYVYDTILGLVILQIQFLLNKTKYIIHDTDMDVRQWVGDKWNEEFQEETYINPDTETAMEDILVQVGPGEDDFEEFFVSQLRLSQGYFPPTLDFDLYEGSTLIFELLNSFYGF